jgi:hypothetical protein
MSWKTRTPEPLAPAIFQKSIIRLLTVGRPIKTSPLCRLEMTLPGEFRGVFGVTVRRMSDGELSRIEGLCDVDRKRLTSASVVPLLRLEPGIPPVKGLPSRGAGRREPPLAHDGTNEGIRYGAVRSTGAEQAFASPFRPRVS